jgi:2,5-dihydroxypyridine 5,6-dioxygenase
MLERCVGAHQMRVHTHQGTDATFRRMRFDEDAGPLEPRMWRPFPVGGVNFYPDATDGVLIVEEATVTGVPVAPVTVELRDNVVTDITGGVDADRLRRFGPTGYYLRHAFGHLLVLDEPAIREAAAAFGDPAVLLDDEPVVPLPGP